jgi:hypothetical protein
MNVAFQFESVDEMPAYPPEVADRATDIASFCAFQQTPADLGLHLMSNAGREALA